MKAAVYEPISVLFVTRGFPRKELPYHFTPYRFDRNSHHNDHKGEGQQFHYNTVHTEDDYYCRLLFDGETLSWRLIEVKKEGIDLLKLSSINNLE